MATPTDTDPVATAIDAGLLGLLPWAMRHLPAHFTSDAADFHWEISEAVVEHKRVAVAAPRAHAKSTALAFAWPLFRAAVFREPFTLITSDTGPQAAQRVTDVHAELLDNAGLVSRYPHLMLPDRKDYARQRVKSTTREFVTVGGIRFTGAGAGQSLRGIKERHQRPTLIIVDDLENDENVLTAAQRSKLWDWFTKGLLNLPGPEGARFVVIGTILHKQSLLSRLLSPSESKSWKQLRYRALTPAGEALWPSAWPPERLEQQRALIGSRAFATEFLNDPADDDNALWRSTWLDANRVANAPALERIAVAVDPATSSTGDACGIITGGTAEGHGYTLADDTIQGSPATWARAALDAYKRHAADFIVAEKNQGGEMILQTIRSVLKPGEPEPRVVLVHASRGKATRADPIAALDEAGRLHLVGDFPDLEDELTSWVPGGASPNRLDAYVWLWSELLGSPAFELVLPEGFE